MMTLYWCRKFGQFVDMETGAYATGATFRGNNMEWYETLAMTIITAMNRSGANKILLNNAPLAVLATSVLYVANISRKSEQEPLGHFMKNTPVFGPGIRAIPTNEICLMKGNEQVARVLVLELGTQ